mmetsp:Transcript_29464/g.29952  ORF Transcript_29464/g.29952 Transcript_29464/m.29952 type:complete len:82 (+) Transcript_29464:761-1006(+)
MYQYVDFLSTYRLCSSLKHRYDGSFLPKRRNCPRENYPDLHVEAVDNTVVVDVGVVGGLLDELRMYRDRHVLHGRWGDVIL